MIQKLFEILSNNFEFISLINGIYVQNGLKPLSSILFESLFLVNNHLRFKQSKNSESFITNIESLINDNYFKFNILRSNNPIEIFNELQRIYYTRDGSFADDETIDAIYNDMIGVANTTTMSNKDSGSKASDEKNNDDIEGKDENKENVNGNNNNNNGMDKNQNKNENNSNKGMIQNVKRDILTLLEILSKYVKMSVVYDKLSFDFIQWLLLTSLDIFENKKIIDFVFRYRSQDPPTIAVLYMFIIVVKQIFATHNYNKKVSGIF